MTNKPLHLIYFALYFHTQFIDNHLGEGDSNHGKNNKRFLAQYKCAEGGNCDYTAKIVETLIANPTLKVWVDWTDNTLAFLQTMM